MGVNSSTSVTLSVADMTPNHVNLQAHHSDFPFILHVPELVEKIVFP